MTLNLIDMQTIKINKVLIALDYDPTAKKVAEDGYAMAKAMGAEVILLHVVENLIAYSLLYLNMGSLQLDSVVELKDASQQFLDKTKLLLGDITIQTVVREGDFADSIIEALIEFDIDILVMGSLSKRWLEDIIMGSVTEQVMKKTPIPIFIVPTRKRINH
jgi:nucleotide-binding universal stress UspA family protein